MEKIYKRLYSFSKFGIRLGLENMIKILDKLDNPQKKYKCIHIAGTNGKGSTASMIESVLLKTGTNVGKYTSPHLVNFNERIVLNGKEILDEEIAEYFLKVEKVINELNIEPTFFEVTTALMFLYFFEKKAEYVVLETGLGGKYDATNVVVPVVSVITNVTNDHSDYLGDTIEKIAEEKAGIIKDNVPLFTSEKKPSVLDVFMKKTDLIYKSLERYKYTYSLNYESHLTEVKIGEKTFDVNLFGDFQAENFVLAYDVLKFLGIDEENIIKGVKSVLWAGRFEIIKGNPIFIIDGAHNEDSARRLKENFIKSFENKKCVIITSVLKDKEVDKILSYFSEISKKVIFTSITIDGRGLSAKEMGEKYSKYFEYSDTREKIEEAIKEAIKLEPEIILIAGSLYLVGEVKKLSLGTLKGAI